MWAVTHFLKPTVIPYQSRMYLITLSNHPIVGSELEEGYYTLVERKLELSPDATVIFLTPPA